MKARLISALAASLAISQMAAPAAQAAAPAHFRTAQAQSFSAADLQRYGLDAASTAKVMDLQRQGYRVVAMTPEEAQKYHAGQFSQTTWLIIAIAAVAIVAIVASN